MPLNNPKVYELDWAGKKLTIETGRVAKQAGGSVLVRMGDTVVFVAATANPSASPSPFLPLTCIYEEKMYAAGKFPGGFFKREGRPAEKEVQTSRLIDRPVRPLFDETYAFETQVIAQVWSADGIHTSDNLAIVGASAALSISDIPWNGPVCGARVGYIDGQYVLNPTVQQMEQSLLDATVVVRGENVVMVEGGARFLGEDVIVGALEFAKQGCQPVLELQRRMVAECGKAKFALPPARTVDPALLEALNRDFRPRLKDAARTKAKHARGDAFAAVEAAALAALGTAADGSDRSGDVEHVLEDLKYRVVRELIREGVRVDGRDARTVRDIEIEVGFLPRPHGSALFTRGETQSVVTVTLGSGDDEQRINTLEREGWKKFYLHYNFPPYSVGEVRRMGSPGRREIGHGLLAERAIANALPDYESFPYTIRAVSEITESNGSSSMATVCGSSLALMHAGVPIRDHIAGVAMGLIEESGEFVILTDILGDEDHLGDMDFKVAGSEAGITSFQMDIKIQGINRDIMARALDQAKVARLHIIERMRGAIATPNKELSPHAPALLTVRIPKDRIGDVIGPGGKNIRALTAETSTKIDIEEDGLIKIFSSNQAGAREARRRIEQMTREIQPGEYYVGTVRKIVDFGAFVEIIPGTDGLVHISEIAEERIRAVTDVLSEGDRFPVIVLDVDPQGKIRLSRKRALGKSIDEIGGG